MSEKILIIDDEQDIADLLEVYLKNENYMGQSRKRAFLWLYILKKSSRSVTC